MYLFAYFIVLCIYRINYRIIIHPQNSPTSSHVNKGTITSTLIPTILLGFKRTKHFTSPITISHNTKIPHPDHHILNRKYGDRVYGNIQHNMIKYP